MNRCGSFPFLSMPHSLFSIWTDLERCEKIPEAPHSPPKPHSWVHQRRVEWSSVVFSDENRFCLYVSDGRRRVWCRPGEHLLPECIRPRHTGPTSSFKMSYNSQSQLVFLQVKVNSACYIGQVVNPVLLPVLRQEGDVLFRRTTHVHIRLLQHNVIFVMYNNSPGQQDPQISHQFYMYGTWKCDNSLFLQSLPQPLQNCNNGCKMLWTIYRKMTICMREYTPVLLPEEATLCTDVTVWAPLTVMCVSVDLDLLSYTPTLITYLSYQFSLQWTFLEGVAFFLQ